MRRCLPVFAALGPAAAAAAGTVPPGPTGGSTLSGVVLSLLLVLALIFALTWLLRRMQFARPGGGRLLTVLAQLPLGPRDRILLLRVGDRQALVAISGAGIRSLQLLEREVQIPDAEPTPPSDFLVRLRGLMEGGRP